jgi:hypothetical protein
MHAVLVGWIGGVFPAQMVWSILIVGFIWALLSRHRFVENLLFIGDSLEVAVWRQRLWVQSTHTQKIRHSPLTEINKIKSTKRQQHNLGQYFKEHNDQLRKAYFEANRDRDRAQQKDIRNAWKNLQDAKDRMRPFLNNASGELKRQSVLILVRASRTQQKRQARKQNRIAD